MGGARKVEIGPCQLWHGDCRDVLAEIAAASVASCCTDPPYHLTSIVDRFGGRGAAPARSSGPTGVYKRASKGFMEQTWDGGDVAFDPATWTAVLRVLKPGAHLAAFSGTRTYHHMATAIEAAGFTIRDMLAWLYGQGFPKSHDVSKALDKAAGAQGQVVGRRVYGDGHVQRSTASIGYGGCDPTDDRRALTEPATEDAKLWRGWGTALKPAHEPICLARKALAEKSVAKNVAKHGAGAINVDGSRIEAGDDYVEKCASVEVIDNTRRGVVYGEMPNTRTNPFSPLGRWPANVLHDGSLEVLLSFPAEFRDASRFFYSPKADAADRGKNNAHPTVKPSALVAWLAKLMTPPGGVVLDPFMGSGTTGVACIRLGLPFIGVEREREWFDVACRRIGDAVDRAESELDLGYGG